MSDYKPPTEEEYEASLNATSEAAMASECADLAAMYRKRAGELFAGGNDKLAIEYRDAIVPELMLRARDHRERQIKHDEVHKIRSGPKWSARRSVDRPSAP